MTIEDVIEHTADCIKFMARDRANADILREQPLVRVVTRMLGLLLGQPPAQVEQSRKLQVILTGILVEVSNDPHTAFLIKGEGAQEMLGPVAASCGHERLANNINHLLQNLNNNAREGAGVHSMPPGNPQMQQQQMPAQQQQQQGMGFNQQPQMQQGMMPHQGNMGNKVGSCHSLAFTEQKSLNVYFYSL